MSFTRRNFLIGAGSGLSVLVLTACVDGEPQPTPSPTRPSPVPKPAGVLRSSWSTDSFARGSHSFMPVGSAPEHRQALAEPLLGRLFFAGEATSADNPGTLLGARHSGVRASIEVAGAASDGDRIAVIGAGIAGAEAARLLAIRGYEVVVIEARDRIGGRIDTIDAEDWPITVELGPWRLREDADADLLAYLARLSVGSALITAPALYRAQDADTAENPVGQTAVETAVVWAAEQQVDLPLSAAIEDSGAARAADGADVDGVDGTALLDQYLAFLAAVTGADASQLSSWFGVSPHFDQERAVTGPLSSIVSHGLEGVETFLSTVVLGIGYDQDSVSLQLGTGESLRVDRAIVTVPLGVLKDDAIEFDPLLPFSHRTAIASLGVGSVETVWLRFDEPFWSTDAVAWNLVGTEDELTMWFNLEPLTGEPILVGVIGGEPAVRLAALEEDDFVALARRSLEPFARP